MRSDTTHREADMSTHDRNRFTVELLAVQELTQHSYVIS